MENVWRRLIWTVLWFLAGALVANIAGVALLALIGKEAYMAYGNLVVYPLMFIPAMGYHYLASRKGKFFGGGRDFDSSNFAPLGPAVCALLVSLATIATAFVFDYVTELLPPMPAWIEEAMKSLLEGPFWVTLLSVSVLAPLCEEWLCRGVVLRGLLMKMKPGWAIAVSALFFAAIHLNPWQGIPAFALGCLFGWVYWKTGSIKLTILMHCVNNTLSAVLSRIPGLEELDSFADIFGSPIHYWITFAACALLAILYVRALNRVDQKVLEQ